MRIVSRLRAFVGAIPRASVRREARRLLATTHDCRGTQQQVLKRLLALNAQSRFSRERRLASVRNVAEFRRRLPITDYEYFRPYIERLKQGDHQALLGPQNRLLMFSLSSGTTSASKYIPITEQFLSDYRRGWQAWGIHTLDAHPGINSRKILQFSSDYDCFRTKGGTPCGNISGLATAMQKPIVRTMYTVPGIVSKIEDPDAKNYTALRLALADEHVAMVVTANPSTLIQLAKLADCKKEQLIRDIAEGTLAGGTQVGRTVRRALRFRLRRNRARARQLEQLVERTGSLLPQDYWPGLEVVAVWTGGSAGAYLQRLRQFYGDAAVRDHGLSASEGRMTIPIHDDRSDGILDVASHFFEFIPEEQHESNNPNVLEAHELEEDRNYFILLTTSSGLYRYDICDVVRCVGFHHTTPMLEFLHKGAHIANVTGEKISESQTVAAVRNAVEQVPIYLEQFTLSPVWGDPPRYRLFAEEQDIPSMAAAERLVNDIDRQLQHLNREYREKRQTGRLAGIVWSPLPTGTWSKFTRRRQQKLGGSFEQYKHPCLAPDLEFGDDLIREFASGTLPAERGDRIPA